MWRMSCGSFESAWPRSVSSSRVVRSKDGPGLTFHTPQNATPTFQIIASLPEAVEADGGAPPESATVLALSPSQLAATDGHGRLYLIALDSASSSSPGNLTHTFTLSLSDDGSLSPFRLHSIDRVPSTGETMALLSVVVKLDQAPADELPSRPGPPGMTTAPRAKVGSKTAFEYIAVSLGSLRQEEAMASDGAAASEEETSLSVKWRLRGADLPSYVAFVNGSYAIGTASKLVDPSAARPTRSTAPASATSPGPSSALSASDAPSFISASPRPPPFSWTQDSESLHLLFPLPSSTPTSAIRVTFSRQYLSLVVGTPRSALAQPGASSLVSHKRFWGEIDVASSLWTFDREAEGRDGDWGVLSLHLEKAHAGTKWPDVFAQRAEGEGALEGERELEGVRETLDPSELAGIVERMEQWHRESGLTPGGAASAKELEGEFEGGEMPVSLQGEEMDVEVDGDSGTPLVVSWVRDATTNTPRLSVPPAGMSFSLLSTALPLAGVAAPQGETLTVKHDVDGLAFSPTDKGTFEHQATFPALAFVLASKRDLHYVHHVRDRLVLAFDSPSNLALSSAAAAAPNGGKNKAGAGTGSLFVYWNTLTGASGKSETQARQAVLKVGQGGEGALLGVAGMTEEDGRVRVVALCEKAVVVFQPL